MEQMECVFSCFSVICCDEMKVCCREHCLLSYVELLFPPPQEFCLF